MACSCKDHPKKPFFTKQKQVLVDACMSSVAIEKVCKVEKQANNYIRKQASETIAFYEKAFNAQAIQSWNAVANMFFYLQSIPNNCLPAQRFAEYIYLIERHAGYCDPSCCDSRSLRVVAETNPDSCLDDDFC